MNYIESFSISSITFYLILGGIVGLIVGIAIAMFLGRLGLFTRKNRFYNFLAKLYYVYFSFIFVIIAILAFGVWGIESTVQDGFEKVRGKVTELSVYATYSALSEIELATGGANLGEEFIGDIANVISGFNHSELSFVFLTGQEGLTTAFKAKRYEIFTFFEAHVYSVLLNSLGEGGPYSPVELKAIVERDLIAEFQEGYVADLAWSRISAGFTPLYVRLLVILSVLFSLAFIEPAMYFIIGFLRKRILQFPEPQPNKSPARVTTGS